MTEADAPVKEDERVITLEVLGDCNSTFIAADVVVEEDELQWNSRYEVEGLGATAPPKSHDSVETYERLDISSGEPHEILIE